VGETLEQVLADARSEARALGRHAPSKPIADAVLDLCDKVAAAAEDWLRFLPEPEAMLRTGYGRSWLRARYATWASDGHARREGQTRYYRAAILPRRTPDSIIREQARRGERAS
jgi:hypothetical protein